MRQPAFRVLYIDESKQNSQGVILTIEGNHVVVPREGDLVQVNDEEFIVEYIVHSFLKNSPIHVIEVRVVNRFEFCMRE